MGNIDLEKSIWTEDDFDSMQWHDCKIYAIAFKKENFELVFDIDYIMEWINQKEGESYFKFWVVPATLVFRNVYSININSPSVDFQIQNIYRDDPVNPKNVEHTQDAIEYSWTIETTDGQIAFQSVGYKQFAREKPRLLDSQLIDLTERGGICFDIM